MFLAALGLLAVSCGKDSSPEPDGSCMEIKVSPEVGMTTRGYNTAETLDCFDLYIENSRNSRYSYTNTRFTRGADGKWTSARQMLWERPAGTPQHVKVLAIYPPQETAGHSLGDTPIALASVESKQSADSRLSDFMTCVLDESDVSWNDSRFTPEGELRLQFIHNMSLLHLEITLGTEFNRGGVPEQNPVTDLKIDGTELRGAYRPAASGGYELVPLSILIGPPFIDAETVYPYELEWHSAAVVTENCRAVYECILLPQKDVQLTVSFLVDGIPYKWTSEPGVAFTGGEVRTLPLTVGKDGVIAGDMTVDSWQNGGENNIGTE